MQVTDKEAQAELRAREVSGTRTTAGHAGDGFLGQQVKGKNSMSTLQIRNPVGQK